MSDEEKRYWKKIAETIYRTVREQFNDEDLKSLLDDSRDRLLMGDGLFSDHSRDEETN